jgi:hypothetical protein
MKSNADQKACESGDALVVTGEKKEHLLFCETLLEEYEALHQPKLDKDKLRKIRAEINSYRTCPKDESEEDFGGRMLKLIYQLINKAQRNTETGHAGSHKHPKNTADRAEVKHVVDGSAPAGNGHQQSNGTGARYDKPILPDPEKLRKCTLRSALCLSGGGVRSATFNLGIIQGLARHGLLDKFDYLSTVSGGGFIGGWLSAWIRRDGMKKVCADLRNAPESPVKPDPGPVEHLRIYSNYLSPQPGLLSADTWTLVASVIRNLLLNWLVFVPVLIALLLLPRLWTAIVLRSTMIQDAWWISLGIGSISGLWALIYIGWHLPSANEYKLAPKTVCRYKGGQGNFIKRCLIWLVVSAAGLAVFLWTWQQPGTPPLPWYFYSVFMAVVSGLAWLTVFLKIIWEMKKKRHEANYKPPSVRRMLEATAILVVVVPVIAGFIAHSVILLALPIFQTYPLIYSVFSVPLILLLLGVKTALIAGFVSRFSEDFDQEWWARAGAWILIVVIAWSTVHLLVLYGPLLLLTLSGPYWALKNGGLSALTWADWGRLLATISGIVSGAVTLFGGVSAKTPANSKEAQKAGRGGLLLAVATQLLAPIFLGFLIILLSFGTNWIVGWASEIIRQALPTWSGPKFTHPLSAWHIALLKDTPFRLLFIISILIALLGCGLGLVISTNMFSLQYLWRNRIIRAYLGASHSKRDPDDFTGFDSFDNLQMHELWPQPGSKTETCTKREDRPRADLPPTRDSKKLFHILNMALNLTGGEKLQWQDRKAESFTVSPLHAGSYWLGYRRSRYYGGTHGITLGASIAISGAFVSPNMGFMMTSPVVRFLMAVFNVRFGWWLGNPGKHGNKTFELDSPYLSVLPFLNEAFGNIDNQSPYVYLSDGGHFENLGLYEMVLRRCRLIVVCDATTDPDYSFESLAMSIRQIRVDLGVPIDIPELAVGVPSQTLKSKYCAIGRIRYSCVDKDRAPAQTLEGEPEYDDDYDGVLIFIKPSLIGQEPRDIINYWQSRSGFPQETITDQWFSEAQFESYRALGSYIIEAICRDKNKDKDAGEMSLDAFAQQAHDHNLLNFDAFREQIGLMALEHEFKTLMQSAPVDTYQAKVRDFMNRLLR